MSKQGPMLHYAASASTLRPKTPKSIATSQERTQNKWQNLQHYALGCPAFVDLLYILVCGLDPSQTDLLEARSDLSHIFDTQHSLPEERYAILLHLYRMATSAADQPVLTLSSVASRLEVWRAFHQSVLKKAPPLTTLRFGSVKAGDIQSFLNRTGRPMDLSEVRSWTGQLWHTLPFEPPWHFPFPVDLTLEQEGQVTTALGTLQGILEQVAAEPAFDPNFLIPIALSSFPWATSMLQEWAQTAPAAELAFQAAHRMLECRTDRQGLAFLVVVVLVHHFLWGVPTRALVALGPPGLRFDLSEESFDRSLEALTAYIDLFGLQDVMAERVFVRVQPLLVDMSPQRVKEWRDCLRGELSTPLIDDEGGNQSLEVGSGKEADLVGAETLWFRRPGPWWGCLVGDD